MQRQSNLRRFLGFLRPYRFRILELFFYAILSRALTMVPLYFLKLLVDEVKDLIAAGQSQHAWRVVLVIFGAQLAMVGINGAMILRRRAILVTVGQRLVFDIRQQLFRHLQRLSLRYYESTNTGRIMSRVLWDVEAVQHISTGSMATLFADLLGIVVVLVLMFYKSWQVGLIGCIVLPLYGLNYLFFRRRIREASMEAREKFSHIYGWLQEKLSGVRVVKSFVRERTEMREFVSETRESLELNMRLGMLSGGLGATANVISGLGRQIVFIYIMYKACFPHTMTVGDMAMYSGLLAQLYGPVLRLVTVNDVFIRAGTALDRIFAVLDTAPEVEEAPDAIALPDMKGKVEFRNVFFSYEPDELVLKNISFVAEPGTVTALVGPSGGGKSTIVNLIPRFYDPISGQVLIDDIDVRKLKLNSLRQNIGIVLQETFLFSGTIRENIKYGKPDATDEEVIEAAKAANAHEFIMELRDGYDTEIGERGVKLSGGQKQRLAIARAILRNPRILILDEATSSLDSESEHLIQQALARLMENRTTFAIAHRLSTVMNADQILVVDNGEIIERGTHAELIKAGGRYAKLAEIQFKAPGEESEQLLKQSDELWREAAEASKPSGNPKKS